MNRMFRCAILIGVLAHGSQVMHAQAPLAQADLRVIPDPSEMHQMLPSYLNKLAEEATEKRLARFNQIQTGTDFRTWQEANRRAFLALIGGLPTERSPLHARVTGEIPREGYVIRKVIFESLPEYYVTANLYVPTTGKAPFPAVLTPCGHSANGKAYDVYQHLFIGLVKRGYVVLSYDPMGQGERYQYWNFLQQETLLKGTDNQHAMAGLQEMLLGQNLARYFIWDGIRGLDYLTSLPEVDPSRLGVTGSSGGGTLTTYISMLDPRVKVASIVCFITSLPQKIAARSLDVEADPEQDIPGLLAAGLDETEFVGMIAPRPVLIGAAMRDFFPIQGTRQIFSEVQSLYKKLGEPEHIKMVEFDHRHMYSQPLREATYAWFDHWLKGLDAEAHEPEIVTEKDATLQCTTTGQVITSLGGKSIYDFNRAQAEEELRRLEVRRRAADFHTTLAGKIRSRLAVPADVTPPVAKTLATIEVGNLVVEKLLLDTEPGISVPTRVIYRKGLQGRAPAVVYLRDRMGEGDRPALFASLAEQGQVVAVADVRGFGETWAPRDVREETEDYFHPRDGKDADFAYATFFLGRPLLGMRAGDALGVVRFLRTRSDVDPKRVAMVGRGWAGAAALFAASLDSDISSTAVEHLPASYGALAKSELYQQPAYILLPGVLEDFDLPDVFAALAPRPLLVLNPQDPLTRKMVEQEARTAFEPVRAAYDAAKASPAFTVRVEPLDTDVPIVLEEWLRARE
ncbi:MAG TPA: acetylxylan esterase [Terriglobia bacterium]|nr:acetylxylan esterase [Terriglobia bacterium]